MADYERRPRQPSGHARPSPYGLEITVPPSTRLRRDQPDRPQQTMQEAFDDTPREDEEFRSQKEDLLERLHSFHAPYEGLNLLFSPFDSYSSRSVAATYQDGRILPETRNDPAVVQPRIGITFLAGADTPQVNQREEASMTQIIPDQKTPAWRVMTAGALLTNFTFSKAMTIEHNDMTPTIVQAYRSRNGADGPSIGPGPPSRAISTRRKPDRLLTIHSDKVKLVNDLSREPWDLEAVLIEVDQSSLIALISNYQGLIKRCGPDLPLNETIQLLDTMIEDARRLCIRSPSLFRMSTRRLIVASKNTRYGVDDSMMFKTLITSSGIKHILSLSAAYFNSLPQSMVAGSRHDQRIQSEVRPRFLQMVVLLLALLNNDDLNQLKEFLQETYGIKADRQHLELLILKVLPLSSINSKIFLQSLVSAVSPLEKPSPRHQDQHLVWRHFVETILECGYILPGNIHEVGAEYRSWIVNWPANGGFKDTSIFRHLQYAGASRTINEIPRVDLNSEVSLGAELNVKLANGRQYIVAASDLDNLVRMSPGRYSVTESHQGGGSFDLEIGDVWVNQPIFRAIDTVNDMLNMVRGIMPHRPQALVRFRRVFSPGGTRYDDPSPSEMKGCGRLTYHVASLNGQSVAVTYKIDGRAIGRRELLRLFQADLNRLNAMTENVRAIVTSTYEGKRTSPQVAQTIARLHQARSEVGKYIDEADRRKVVMNEYSATLPSEPITKVLYQVGASDTQISVWRDYTARHLTRDNVLCIESERHVVHQCIWQEDTIIVTFHDMPMRFFATPLPPAEDSLKHEQLKDGDTVLLCGHYLIVVEPSGETFAPSGVRPIRTPVRARGEPELRVPQPLRPRRPEQELHFHDGLPELEARERGVQSRRYDQDGYPRGVPVRKPVSQPEETRQQVKDEIELKMVVNWLRVTGVETAGQLRVRAALRQKGADRGTTYIR